MSSEFCVLAHHVTTRSIRVELNYNMDIISTGTASLDLLFMTTEEHAAHEASRLLKKLINYILDHLDDKGLPPSLQDLQNERFARGFQAGYVKAYE